ncbi:DUF255 domain-containing protein [Polaribacter sp. Z022]|uniref:thioredoxin family protein n=1 Tax=Polaribacter sp. Z022 TaxID=2927125 RepID=UPI002021B00D|nr:DUF255 domain-containing protein [Polaribacter sp. Z022]MCL7752170.1 DUF255 domain-containing protein [Polaribacter sp. Z022]
MTKIIFVVLLFYCITVQSQSDKEILKIFSFEEVEILQKQNAKPILVYIYTDWCKFCFGMNKNTFSDRKVIKNLNDKFYFIKLNAENKKDITFLNKTFTYKPSGINTGIHELTNELASIKNNVSYPTITKLNQNFEIEFQKVGFINSKNLLQFIK